MTVSAWRVALPAAIGLSLLPVTPAQAASYIGTSAPAYDSPGAVVPVVVTMYEVPARTTSVSISARGTNGATAACRGPVWRNRTRATASRTCYLRLPVAFASFNVVGTAVATQSDGTTVSRSGLGGRAVQANGQVSSGSLTEASRTAIEKCHNTTQRVWLTFDDGANATQLYAILSTLGRNNVKGRFFFTGAWRDQNPSLHRRIVDSGHHVANHSYTHPALSKTSTYETRRQIRRGVAATTVPKLLRPPYGAGAFSSRLVSLAAEQGYKVCRWTVDTRDWDGSSAARMKERVATGDARTPPIFAGGNILMHGTATNTSTGGLQAVIDAVRGRGLMLQPLR